MITSSNSSVKRSGIPSQFLGVLLHTIACSELSRVRTEFCQLPVIPFLAHHPVQTNRQFSRHRDLSDFPSSPHRQVGLQSLRRRTLFHFLLDGSGQLGNRRSQSIEQLQQILPAPARPP